MDINDILQAPTGLKRPDHPDMGKIQDIALRMKADMADATSHGQAQERWEAVIAEIGDPDTIVYACTQIAIQVHGIQNGLHWQMMKSDPKKHMAFVQTLQATFDGFIQGAYLQRSRAERTDTLLEERNEAYAAIQRIQRAWEGGDLAGAVNDAAGLIPDDFPED